MLTRLDGDKLVDEERWTSRDELFYAPEGPIWDRFGSFAGQPHIAGTVVWTTADRRVVIEGRRGEKRLRGASVTHTPFDQDVPAATENEGRRWGRGSTVEPAASAERGIGLVADSHRPSRRL